MTRISAAMRISIGLACLMLSVLFTAQTIGLVPDSEKVLLTGRKALCETFALQCCLAAQKNDLATMRAASTALVERNDSVESVGIRRIDGKLLVEAGNHTLWDPADSENSVRSQVQVPVMQGKRPWGTVEIRFQHMASGGLTTWFANPTVRMMAFIVGSGFLAFTWYLKRVLQHLDPSAVIPDRVRATLDTLAEGVLVLDKEQRIVLANKSFAEHTGRSVEQLQGFKAPNINWMLSTDHKSSEDFPWVRAIREGVSQTGYMIGMQSQSQGQRTMVVNTAPILGADGRRRGALATFDDVTSVEKKNVQLEEMLTALKDSRDEINRQNQELQLLATRDPLTSCLNRRAFFTQFETHWKACRAEGMPLGCLMLDIDHFKSINDNHGHSVGDHVLQGVSAVLRSNTPESGLVCRYGGEEFCVLLPRFSLAQTMELAETLRQAVAGQKFDQLSITSSFGVSEADLGASGPQDLIEQADKALYASKHGGRNRVTSFKDLPPDFGVEKNEKRQAISLDAEADVPIPFHAVTALISALGYRDALTAEHSRRVADLCVIMARGMMQERECYVLEVAGLLHDIGKLGVPDAILLKPGKLTEEEWKVMRAHDQIGVEIIRAAFSSEELAEIVRTHHAWYGDNSRNPAMPVGDAIPLAARILTIADAYDAMVTDRVYRKGRSREAAFQELREFSGRQFDGALVERFIDLVTSSDSSRIQSAMVVSKQTALRIGMQIERLASALDAQDYRNLSAMAGRLAATASKEGVSPIAERASELAVLAASEPDLMRIVSLTTELLQLCRSTQSSYIAAPFHPTADVRSTGKV